MAACGGDTAGLRRYEADRKRDADFLALLSQTSHELRHAYECSGTLEESGPRRRQRSKAADALPTMRDSRRRGYRAYDAWFDAPINNAKLAAISVYSDQVTAFLRLFNLCSGDYRRFYASVQQLGKLDKANRADALKAADACYSTGQS